MRKQQILFISFVIFTLTSSLFTQARVNRDSRSALGKPAIDDYNNYTTVGQLGMTITNYGVIGEGWNNPDQPSCRYKQYADFEKEEVEHFSFGGLWIGGLVKGSKRVSTAIIDGAFDYATEGFEFTTSEALGDTIRIKSSITTSRHFDPAAVSHEDFVCEYSDMNSVVNHNPMGIRIHQESYAWNYSFAEAFVILDYTIYNDSHLLAGGPWTIENLYLGIWMDASVANMNYTNIYEPGGGFTWYDNLDGFDKTTYDPIPDDDLPGYPRDIAYQYDADGDNGYSHSYIGVRCLGNQSVPREYWNGYYRQWVWSASSNMDYPEYTLPVTDAQRYDYMHTSVPKRVGVEGYTSEGWPDDPNSWLFLLSSGPFGSQPMTDTVGVSVVVDSSQWILPPGDSLKVAFAIACGRWANAGLVDNAARRAQLHGNSDWAQKAFNGEDTNGNGILEPGEDTNGNGVLDRYILPAPPPSPALHVKAESNRATLYWGNLPEKAKDPLTQRRDFEGYRIYARKKTVGGDPSGWSLLGQFDLDNDLGYNTGFEQIRLPREEAALMSIVGADTVYSYPYILSDDGDTLYYKMMDGDTVLYRFINSGIKSGWPERNVYAVTSYDRGDPATGLESLESNKIINLTYVIAGETPQQSGFENKVGVYPNPYKARAIWDGFGERERMIWFTNLPRRAKIKIFSLSGELIDEIQHYSETYDGSDISNFSDIAEQASEGQIQLQLAGGEHAWDLISRYDQAIATGLYIFTVEDLDSGDVQRGKFLVIK